MLSTVASVQVNKTKSSNSYQRNSSSSQNPSIVVPSNNVYTHLKTPSQSKRYSNVNISSEVQFSSISSNSYLKHKYKSRSNASQVYSSSVAKSIANCKSLVKAIIPSKPIKSVKNASKSATDFNTKANNLVSYEKNSLIISKNMQQEEPKESQYSSNAGEFSSLNEVTSQEFIDVKSQNQTNDSNKLQDYKHVNSNIKIVSNVRSSNASQFAKRSPSAAYYRGKAIIIDLSSEK